MNIQVFGVNNCADTRKARRYFQERRVSFQYIDLTVRGLSKGELQSVSASAGINNLINIKSKDYAKLNMGRILSADMRKEMLLKHPSLYHTPIVRNGKAATVGYAPDIWSSWE
jgi:Spx/MgsR family transcriptional regulator